jgi:glyceraldehyde-3-phosphate dehydrogenase/erythrose-4-phosphate dehydrogenase
MSLADSKTIAHLTRYDSTHGRFTGTVDAIEDSLIINGDKIKVLHNQQLDQLPWQVLAVRCGIGMQWFLH